MDNISTINFGIQFRFGENFQLLIEIAMRFIVKLESGQTLLIAHNIDLAPRVAVLKVDRRVKIRGEYIWNEQGGLIHKTHLASNVSDPNGWVRYKDVVYQ